MSTPIPGNPVTLKQIIAALSVTYKDAGIAIWLDAPQGYLNGQRAIDLCKTRGGLSGGHRMTVGEWTSRQLVPTGLGSIYVSLPGQPIAKKRPRFTVQNGKVHTYPDAGQTQAEAAVARAYMLAARRRDLDPAKLWAVELWFNVGPTRGRADIDNLTKLWLDGLNGWAWKDDKQVARLIVTLMRGADKPGAYARITEVVEVTG